MLQVIPSQTLIQTHEQAQSARNLVIWQKLNSIRLGTILDEWLQTLADRTRINYRSGINCLVTHGLINPYMTMQAFSLVNHDAVIDKVKLIAEWKETSRQSRAACYISFTRYLGRRFPDIFKKAMPSREGVSKTFYRVHEKVVTEAMNQKQWTAFFDELQKINKRDCLIAKITLQGGKRIREVLSLTIDRINWDKQEITFIQSKTKGMVKETVITYPESVMRELHAYIGDREGLVFLSSKGNAVILNQVANTFAKAGELAGIPFKVTPHVLRASNVTYLRQQGFNASDIMKITGHASSEMVNAYDKSDRADNATKKVCLIN